MKTNGDITNSPDNPEILIMIDKEAFDKIFPLIGTRGSTYLLAETIKSKLETRSGLFYFLWRIEEVTKFIENTIAHKLIELFTTTGCNPIF